MMVSDTFWCRGSVIAAMLTAYSPAFAGVLPTYQQVRASYESSDGKLLDREGRVLQEMRVSFEGRARSWTELKDMSPALVNAVLEAEDHRFREHAGVDWRALIGATWQNVVHGGKRGASTITMQTAGYLDGQSANGAVRHGRRDWWAKVRQIRLAEELEQTWSKDQILEAYLNLVSFRGEQKGVGAAARALFGRDAHGLDVRESALLATLLRAPGMSANAAGDRLCRAAQTDKSLGDCASLRNFALATLSRPPAPILNAGIAPHLARKLLSARNRGVRTTLDLDLQLAAEAAVRDQLSTLKAQNARDAAVIVANNHTGEVLAYVGGSGSGFSASPEVDMAQSRRQAGSTLKPFLYGLAFDKKYLTPDSWLLDEPFEVGLDRGSYEPDNYDHRFHGPVPAKEALASSLNIPAVRVVGLVGVDDFQSLLEKLGFRALADGDHYGPSLALGTADITLFDLVQAYMTLANEGEWRPLTFTKEEVKSRKPLLGKDASREVSAVLSDRGYRALTFGWDSVLATAYPAAVKTGTSKDMRDNWCVGFSRDFTVGVWVGNSSGAPMWAVSGVEGAAPIWRRLMDLLHRDRRAQPLPTLAAAQAPTLDRGRFGRILYPADGAILAADPDIPPAHQRVLIEAEGDGKLFLDGSLLADPLWKPLAGKHRLRLADVSGATLDELSFEVR
jgi:penicillin-binding protein 1C